MATNINKTDYSNKTIYVGLDVHSSKWYATIICQDKMSSKSFDANAEQLANYLKRMYPNARYKAAYEAGCFGFWAKYALDLLGIETIVIHASDIPTSDRDKVQKNDKNDSKKIALALRSQMLDGIFVPTRIQQEHRDLIRRRKDLVCKATCVKNQLKSDLKFYGIELAEQFEKPGTHWSKKFIEWLRELKSETEIGNTIFESHIRELEWFGQEIGTIEKELDTLLQTAEYANSYRIVRSVPGIGPIHSATFILEIMDIMRFKRLDQYLSYVGLIPCEHSSGDSRYTGYMSRRCNRHLRTLFIEAAWIAIKKDLALHKYYESLNKGKLMKANLAIVKVARKLASRLRYILINNEEYKFGLEK